MRRGMKRNREPTTSEHMVGMLFWDHPSGFPIMTSWSASACGSPLAVRGLPPWLVSLFAEGIPLVCRLAPALSYTALPRWRCGEQKGQSATRECRFWCHTRYLVLGTRGLVSRGCGQTDQRIGTCSTLPLIRILRGGELQGQRFAR